MTSNIWAQATGKKLTLPEILLFTGKTVRRTDISNWGVEEGYQEFSAKLKYFIDSSGDVEKAVRHTSLELKGDIRTENVHL